MGFRQQSRSMEYLISMVVPDPFQRKHLKVWILLLNLPKTLVLQCSVMRDCKVSNCAGNFQSPYLLFFVRTDTNCAGNTVYPPIQAKPFSLRVMSFDVAYYILHRRWKIKFY